MGKNIEAAKSNLTVGQLMGWVDDITHLINDISKVRLSSMAAIIKSLSNRVTAGSNRAYKGADGEYYHFSDGGMGDELSDRLTDLAEFVNKAREVLARGMKQWDTQMRLAMDEVEKKAAEAAEAARQARDQFKESADALEKIIPSA